MLLWFKVAEYTFPLWTNTWHPFTGKNSSTGAAPFTNTFFISSSLLLLILESSFFSGDFESALECWIFESSLSSVLSSPSFWSFLADFLCDLLADFFSEFERVVSPFFYFPSLDLRADFPLLELFLGSLSLDLLRSVTLGSLVFLPLVFLFAPTDVAGEGLLYFLTLFWGCSTFLFSFLELAPLTGLFFFLRGETSWTAVSIRACLLVFIWKSNLYKL